MSHQFNAFIDIWFIMYCIKTIELVGWWVVAVAAGGFNEISEPSEADLSFSVGSKVVQIRALRPEDFDELHRLEIKNKNILKAALNFQVNPSSKARRNHLRRQLEHCREGKSYVAVILLDNSIIGQINVQAIDKQNSVGYLGYWLGQDHHRKGLMTACLRVFAPFCFNLLRLAHLDITCSHRNKPSIGVALNCGFDRRPMIKDFDPITGDEVLVFTKSDPHKNSSSVLLARKNLFWANMYHFFDSQVPPFCYPRYDPLKDETTIHQSFRLRKILICDLATVKESSGWSQEERNATTNLSERYIANNRTPALKLLMAKHKDGFQGPRSPLQNYTVARRTTVIDL